MILGADPEVFLKKGNKIVSSIGIIKGTKSNPEELEPGFFIQKDNILAEFNIPPSFSKEEFIYNIKRGVTLTQNYVAKEGLDIDISSFNTINPSILDNDEAKLFGCDPDYIVWTDEKRNLKIENNIRTAGGHVHLSYDNPTDKKSLEIIKALDLFLGVPSILIDKVKERRNYYGGAGNYRHKPYGLEYRTLSNFWIQSKELISWVWDECEEAINFVEKGGVLDPTSQGQLIPDCINNSNIELAKYYINKYKIKLPKNAKIKV